MTTSSLLTRAVLLGLTLLASGPSLAERADRNKPIALEADRISIDDIKRTQTLEGNVVLTQGTLTIRSDRIVVTEDKYGFQKGIAYGGPKGLASFKQKREGVDEWIEGEGERIEYDSNSEVAEFFQRAWIKSGQDELRGDYIWYDAISERYTASAKGEAGKTSGRVKAIIQPKSREGMPPAPAPQPRIPGSSPAAEQP